MTRTYSTTDPAQVRNFAIEAARTAADLKCTDVVLLDVRGHSQVCDYVIVASGTSQRQMKSVATQLEDIGEAMGMAPFRSTRDAGTTWVVVDCVEVVIHLFEPEQRLYYDLELMWAQAGRVDWSRAGRSDGSTSKPAKAARAAAAREPDSDDDDATVKPAAKTQPSAKSARPSSKNLKSASAKPVKKPASKKPLAKKPVTGTGVASSASKKAPVKKSSRKAPVRRSSTSRAPARDE
ncbi:MAG: ribosome silencing factor [Phycisphaerae bacterium]|nr:ribosome silencing factor [Phycisphaerae bacterium]